MLPPSAVRVLQGPRPAQVLLSRPVPSLASSASALVPASTTRDPGLYSPLGLPSFSLAACWMSGSDGEYSLRKSSTASRTPSLSPLPSLSLTRDHITEALLKSPDGGATLDLAYKGLTDVGESGAEELATVGQDEESETDNSVVRYVSRELSDRLVIYRHCLVLRSHTTD